MEELIEELIKEGILKTPAIIEAFRTIERVDFMPSEVKAEADLNEPLPIGYGQTISQPLTVAFMLELLQPQTGEKILDVGSGSGWQTALLAQLVGDRGQVFAIERIRELKSFGEKNVGQYHFDNVHFYCADGSLGLKNEAPFDKIIVAAAAEKIPEALKDQLKISGRLVIPVGEYLQDMVLLIKRGMNDFEQSVYPGFRFVPLIEGA